MYFLDFKVAKWEDPLWHILQILFEYCKYFNFNIFDLNIALILPTAEFLVILAEAVCWEIERKYSQIFNEDFYLPLYLPLCSTPSFPINSHPRMYDLKGLSHEIDFKNFD